METIRKQYDGEVAQVSVPKSLEILVQRGWEIFNSPRVRIEYTHNQEADIFLNDLVNYPHALVFACIMDRQIPAERAWLIPFLLKQKLNHFSMDRLCALSLEQIVQLMTVPAPLHRFPVLMAKNLYSAIHIIAAVYNSDACQIWAGRPSSALVFYRFFEFAGVGPKIASMATNILAREHKIPFSDYYFVDISADTHVRRVFFRLGFTPQDASAEHVIYKARSLYPDFPGLIDLPCFEIGKKWCRPKNPLCSLCYMKEVCPHPVI